MPDLSQICRLLANTCALLRVKLEITGSLPISSGSAEVLRQWVRTASWLAFRIWVGSAYPKRMNYQQTSKQPRMLVRAVAYIQDQLDTDLTVSGIAQAVGMSPITSPGCSKSLPAVRLTGMCSRRG